MSHLRVGGVEVVPLEDAVVSFPIPLSQLFPNAPADGWAPFVQRYPGAFADATTLRAPMRCYVIRSQGRTILVDTGLGPAGTPFASFVGTGGSLPERLVAEGIAPEQIDTVFFTHLHPDHVGWSLVGEPGGYRPRFPNARYLAAEADWQALPTLEQVLPWPYVDLTVRPLAALDVLELSGGEQALTSEIAAVPTPGHMPGHTSLLISSGGQQALIAGDVFASPAQVTNPEWAFGFDMDAAGASQTRRRVLDRLESERIALVAGHFPAPGHGRIARQGGQFWWEPASG